MISLFFLFLIPFIAALIVVALKWTNEKALKTTAIILSLAPLLHLLAGHSSWIGAGFFHDWIPSMSIVFYLAIPDGLTLVFLYLTAIIIPFSLIAIPLEKTPKPYAFYATVLVLQGLLIGFFTARDLALFTIFWEAILLPIYFIMLYWGGPMRKQAAMKFIIYMIAGSTLMVAGVLGLFFVANTFNLDNLVGNVGNLPYIMWISLVFLLAFAVKTPLFPFHAWLPDTYYQAPVAGTILLSALLSKAGIYGFLRIGLGLFPDELKVASPYLIGLAIAGVLYASLTAWMQSDYKNLLAYSSLAHVNFILVGIFLLNGVGYTGAIVQAFNHGVTITALFLVASWLQERIGCWSIGPVQGVANSLPILCWLSMVFILSSVALPSTNNFVGELLILFALFKTHWLLAAILGLSVILSVVYMLKWVQFVFFGPVNYPMARWTDIGWKQIALSIPLIFLIFWVGIYPEPMLNIANAEITTTTTSGH